MTGSRNGDKIARIVKEPAILFESSDLVALDKPPGWLSIPAREPAPSDPVVSQWLSGRYAGDILPVHRLDRFTSGVMIFARNRDAHRTANRWFEKRLAKKVYLFLAAPPPSRPAVQIRSAIDGKPAQTLFEILEAAQDSFFGRATPLTGRFHQIRVHAEEAGFPLLGDRTHGGREAHRVCLHAHELDTPAGTFTAPWPEDLAVLWRQLKHGA